MELVKTGRWEISTGSWTVTKAALASAVAAFNDGGHRKPPLKLGHTDERFDGDPSVGYVDRLRLSSDGSTLIGDYVGLPAWLASVLASAYPSRSVEAICADDGTMVLSAVALLGVTAPGIPTIRSLSDVERLYSGGVAASANGRVVHLLQAATPRPPATTTVSRTPKQTNALRVAASRRRHRRAASILDVLNGGK